MYAVSLSCERFYSGEYLLAPITCQADADEIAAKDMRDWG